METFFTNFENTSAKVQSTNANLSVSPEFHGTIDISKGALKININFYARVYKMRYEDCISLDDWDINDTSDITFSGMPIDDIHKLRTTMINSGLTTIANGLEITNDEYKKEICIQIEQLKAFKDIFGKKARMFNILPNEEKRKAKLKYVIDNYDNMTLTHAEMSEFLEIDEHGNKHMPTIEQLKQII